MTSHSSPYAAARELLPMAQVAERYGFSISRGGFIACPFHDGDNTPSLKIYDGSRGWHCFGCSEGGDVIDFVRRLFNLNSRAALIRLDCDFGLRLMDGSQPTKSQPTPEAIKRAQELKSYRTEYDAKVTLARCCRAALAAGAAGARAGELKGKLDYLDWWFYANPWR